MTMQPSLFPLAPKPLACFVPSVVFSFCKLESSPFCQQLDCDDVLVRPSGRREQRSVSESLGGCRSTSVKTRCQRLQLCSVTTREQTTRQSCPCWMTSIILQKTIQTSLANLGTAQTTTPCITTLYLTHPALVCSHGVLSFHCVNSTTLHAGTAAANFCSICKFEFFSAAQPEFEACVRAEALCKGCAPPSTECNAICRAVRCLHLAVVMQSGACTLHVPGDAACM
jgi:hypothetical protein